MGVRAPRNTTILAAGALTGSYVDKGSAVPIAGFGNLTLHVRSHSGAGDVVVKVFTAPVATTAPTATTALHKYCLAAGTVIELVTPTTEYNSFPLNGLSGMYLMVAAKYSASAANASIWLTATADMG